MNLLIAIPALNEQDSIESIIQRTLAARETIKAQAGLDDVLITVVSDGSTDHTVELASRYTDRIKLIVFPVNRGYGAAIKEAWGQSNADLLAFLDADGTCEPLFFGPLCKEIQAQQADVILGCRLNAESQMPAVRRVGNLIFASILSVLSSTSVRDTASGMRVVRRASLPCLYPLPDGLHFTPAMSARAILSDAVRITEIDMPYHERAGQSKLHVIKDGLRFLRVIVEAALLYRPSRPMSLIALGLMLAAAVLMVRPGIHYLQHRSVAEWMIYRFVTSELLSLSSILLLSASYVSQRMSLIALGEEVAALEKSLTARLFRWKYFWTLPVVLTLAGASLVAASFFELLVTGATYEHWSRYVMMSSLVLTAVILTLTRALDHVLTLVDDRVKYIRTLTPSSF